MGQKSYGVPEIIDGGNKLPRTVYKSGINMVLDISNINKLIHPLHILMPMGPLG
jgi:hypothetical protein